MLMTYLVLIYDVVIVNTDRSVLKLQPVTDELMMLL